MPTVAIVEAVRIRFYAQEHPPAHFHADFAEHRATIDIASLRVLKGSLPRAKLTAVLSWAEPRREELARAWDAVLGKRHPEKIK